MGYKNLGKARLISFGQPTILGFTLDEIGAAEAAYSFRQLSQSYLGSAIEVRRSSDNTELNVGFDVAGNFNSTELSSFLSGANGFATTAYDQSGNGYHLTQSTAGSQPQIVLEDSQYVFKFQSDFLENLSFVGSLGGEFTLAIAWKVPITKPSGFASFQPGLDWAAGQNFFSPWHTTIQHASFYSDSQPVNSQAGYEDGKWRQIVLKYSGGQVSAYEFGAQIMEPTTCDEPGWTRLILGKNDFGNGDFYCAELILWSGDKDPNEIYQSFKVQNQNLLQPASAPLYVAAGDSITTTLFCGLGKSWSKFCFDDLGADHWHTICNGGWTLQDLNDRISIFESYSINVAHTDSYFVCFAGTNDRVVDGVTAEQALDRVKTLAFASKNAGYGKFVIISPLPRFQSGTAQNIAFQAWNNDFTDLLLADTSGAIDGVLDVRTLVVGVNGEQDNLTYYVNDFVHLNAAGEEVVGLAASQLISELLGV